MSDRVHTTIDRKIYNKHRKLVLDKYGKLHSVTYQELNRAVKNHCKLLESELKQKKDNGKK